MMMMMMMILMVIMMMIFNGDNDDDIKEEKPGCASAASQPEIKIDFDKSSPSYFKTSQSQA